MDTPSNVSNMSVQIRRASIEEALSLVTVLHAAVDALGEEPYGPEERAAWLESVTEESMRNGLQAPEPTTFVAENGSRVVGFTTRHGTDVRALYVHPEAQGQGIGSALLGVLERQAQAAGIQTLDVSASLNAVGFYEAHGYERVRESALELEGDVAIRCVDMEKDLA